MDHRCSLCPYLSQCQAELISHLIKRHKNCANFIVHCSANGCGASFKNHNSFRRHCYRKHLNQLASTQTDDDIGVGEINSSVVLDTSIDGPDDTLDEGAFVLKLTAAHKLSQKAVRDVMESAQELVQSKLNRAKEKLSAILNPEQLHILQDEIFSSASLFSAVDTEYKQEKFFESKFQYIKPESVVLGQSTMNKKIAGVYKMSVANVCGYVVPFLPQLTALLSMPEVQECLRDGNINNLLLSDYYDGCYIQNHEFLAAHKNCLCFSIYTDDFEVVNPIGTHRKKHKITAFYWTLLNIPVEYRSRLGAIQLAALAKTADLKLFGSHALLDNICLGFNSLWNGHQFEIPRYGRQTHYGMLCFVLADTLAAQQLGGFKEGVGNAQKPCRTCEIERNDMKKMQFSNDCQSRNEIEHRDRVETLQTLSKKARVYWSKKWGVNTESALLRIPGFSLTKGFLHDPMHVLLEGIVKTEVKGLLNVFIKEKKYLTLKEFNERITNFSYSASESRDKPQVFDAKSLEAGSVLCQTAASMKTLIIALPCLIGDRIPEDDLHWRNFLRLLQIVLLTLSAVASLKTVQALEQLIAAHNAAFLQLYPNDSFTPKMHYLVHFPRQLLDFGPIRIHSCMRNEAKNGFFKSKRWFNFKKIEKSLAFHHQRWMCLQMLGSCGQRSTSYVYGGDEVAQGITISVKDDLTITQALQIDPASQILVSPKIVVKGQTYTTGTILLKSFEEEPLFLQIERILIVDHRKIFQCRQMNIINFNNHLNMFVVEATDKIEFEGPENLLYKWPQISRPQVNGETLVMMYCADDVWVL